MPNPENFPNYIPVPIDQRPSRLNNSDTEIFAVSNKQILFGTDARDVVELWFYNPNGSLAAHSTLSATDEALGLNTVIDNTGAFEFTNLDMTSILKRVGLEQGRYQIVANFFRSEVGEETGNKFYITDISPDRTELKLHAKQTTKEIVSDIYEFIVPSVPKNEAQGLMSLVFGKTNNKSQSLTPDSILAEMNQIIPDTSIKVDGSDSRAVFSVMMNDILNEVYPLILNNMYADIHNPNVQEYDLQTYIRQAVQDVVNRYRDSSKVDSKFNIF